MRYLAALGLGVIAACFTPPDADVLFSCSESESECPDGYSCEDDGCCHKNGSDVEASFGGCRLAPAPATETTGSGSSSSDTGSSTSTSTSSGGGSDGSSGSSGSGSSSTG